MAQAVKKRWRVRGALLLAGLVAIFWGSSAWNWLVPPPPLYTSVPPPPCAALYSPDSFTPRYLRPLGLSRACWEQPAIAAQAAKVLRLGVKLDRLERVAYARDPVLGASEHYQELLRAWQGQLPACQREARRRFEGASDPELARRHQLVSAQIAELLNLVFLKEQVRAPDFAPLFEGVFYGYLKIAGRVDMSMTNDKLLASLRPAWKKACGRGVGYLIGARIRAYLAARPPAKITTYEQWLAQLDRRYREHAAAIARLVEREAVPADVVEEIKADTAARLLAGEAYELYWPLHKPLDIARLRLDLQEQTSQLVRLRDAARKPRPWPLRWGG